MDSISYSRVFKKYYSEWISRMKLENLLRYEDNLSLIIGGDLFDDCLLADEIIDLHMIVRDQIVYRCALKCGFADKLKTHIVDASE